MAGARAFTRSPPDRDLGVVAVARALAKPYGVGEPVERLGDDRCARLPEARLFRRHFGWRDVGHREAPHHVGGRIRLGDVDLFARSRALEPPPGRFALALDLPALPAGAAIGDRLDALRGEAGRVDPRGTLRARLGERIGHHVDRLRVGRQHDEAAVAGGAVGVRRHLLEVLGPDHDARERLAVRRTELDQGAATVALHLGARTAGRNELQARAVLVADRLALPDPERACLQHELAHFRVVGRVAAALGDHPTLALARDRECAAALGDTDRRDLGRAQALQQRLAEHVDVGRPLRAFLLLVE
ncbi:MAG: hypothetical protein M5U08_25695 [Burkholderiales bacterium]|nr:hypothetical protein [Burkholderiales bacterium]